MSQLSDSSTQGRGLIYITRCCIPSSAQCANTPPSSLHYCSHCLWLFITWLFYREAPIDYIKISFDWMICGQFQLHNFCNWPWLSITSDILFSSKRRRSSWNQGQNINYENGKMPTSLYGFKRLNNSCAFDTTLVVHLYIYHFSEENVNCELQNRHGVVWGGA